MVCVDLHTQWNPLVHRPLKTGGDTAAEFAYPARVRAFNNIMTGIHRTTLLTQNLPAQQSRDVGIAMKRLSTGLRVNRSGDAPSNKALHNIRSTRLRNLTQGIANTQDAMTMSRLQDHSLSQIEDIVLRMRDLALRAANEAVNPDRDALDLELQELKTLINKIAYGTTFNGLELLTGNPVDEITITNPAVLANPGEHPTWNTAGSRVAFESDRVNGAAWPLTNAYRIWSDTTTPSGATQETTDPASAPRDGDGDGYVDHPLSDLYDSNPTYPNAPDTDGDGWPDPIDPFPGNPAYPAGFADADGDGFVDHPWMDADDLDPTLPTAVDADGDGFVDHPWMEPDDTNPNIPDPTFDGDGDGEIDYYDPWPTDPLLSAATPPDGDGDGWPAALDPDDGNPGVPGGAPPDGDGDGTIDFYDPWPGNPAANPANPLDSDGDTIPDDFDPAPGVNNNVDSDGDTILDIFDPLPANPNYPTNTDADGDGYPDDVPGLFDPVPGDPAYPDNTDSDGDGYPDVFDPAPANNSLPGPLPADVDGDTFVDLILFDMDDLNPLVPFDNSIDADADGYPWYIDGGPGDPAGDDTNPYMPLARICYEDHDPDWASGGIAFVSNRNTYYTSAADAYVPDIFILRSGVITSVTNDANIDSDPAWAGDSKQLAWVRDGDIYTVSINTAGTPGTPQFLTAGGGAPAWRPYEDTVFFTQGGDIMSMKVGGAAPEPLISVNNGAVTGDNPCFHPNGDIMFYRRGADTYYYDFKTGREEQLTGVFANADFMDVSPTGAYIAYSVGAVTARNDMEVTFIPTAIQTGAENTAGDRLEMLYGDARTGALGIAYITFATQSESLDALSGLNTALERLAQSRIGVASRMADLERELDDLHNSVLGQTEFTARLVDADAAQEITNLARARILSDTAAAQFAQAGNISAQRVRSLLHNVLPA